MTARGNVSLAVAGFAIATLGLSATASAVTVPTLDCSIPNASISGLGPIEQNDTITVNALGLLTGDTVRFEFTRAATGNGNPNFSLVSSGSATVDPVSYNPIVLNKAETETYDFDVLSANIGTKTFTMKRTNSELRQFNWTASCVDGSTNTAFTAVKSATPTTYDAVNDVINYSVLVTNTGNVTLTGLTIQDNLTSDESCPVSTLAPNAFTTCTASYTIVQKDLNDGSVENTASIDTEQTEPQDTNTVTVTATVEGPSLTAVKSAIPTMYSAVDDIIDYSILVTNNGGVTLTGLTIEDDLTDNENCPVSTLEPTEFTTCTASYTITLEDLDEGSVENTARVDTDQTEPQDTNTVTVTGDQLPSLSAIKSANPSTYDAVNDVINYSVLVTNTGNVTLTGLTIQDDLTNNESCPVSTLAPNAFTTCTASYAIKQQDLEDGSVENTARIDTEQTEPRDTNTVTVFAATTASLELTKVADQATFDENDASISYTYTVRNTGTNDLTGIYIEDDKIASVSCNATALVSGAQTLCFGAYQISPIDIIAGKIVNTATAYGTLEVSDDVVSNTEEVTVTYIGKTVEDAIEEATGSFIMRRMDRLLSDGPDRARLLRKRADRSFSQAPVDFTASGGSGGSMNLSYSTSLQQVMSYSAGNDARKLQPSSGGPTAYNQLAMAHLLTSGGSGADLSNPAYEDIAPASVPQPSTGPFDVWVEGQYTTYDSDYGDGDFGVTYVGADWLINDRLLVGLLAQFDWMAQEEGSASKVDGFGWMVGPYMSAEIVNNVFFDARVAWGQSDNDVTVNLSDIPFSGDFDTDRWLAQANLSGNYSRGDWRVTPEISVAYIEEKRKSFDVSDDGGLTNTTIDSETFALGRLTAGPELAYRFVYGPMTIEPQLAVRFIWDFLAEGDEVSGMPIYDTSPRGAVEVGLGMQGENGVNARLGAKYDGVGTGGGLEAINFNGWLNIPF